MNMKQLFFIFLLFCAAAQSAKATIRYVRPFYYGSGTGADWANSYGNLHVAIDASVSGDEIWVAAGTYRPTRNTGNAASIFIQSRVFMLKSGVKIYGGFAGTETMLSQRNVQTNPTILSGDHFGNDYLTGSGAIYNFYNNTENSTLVVAAVACDNATLDGFTIKGGNGVGSVPNQFGFHAFYHTSPITYVLFADCGGLYAESSSSLVVKNCTFTENYAVNGGAGVTLIDNTSPTMENCTFFRNASNYGAGLYCANNTVTLRNNIFLENNAFGTGTGGTSGGTGGGLYLKNAGSSTVQNCVFYKNAAVKGAGTHCLNNSSVFTNCTFANNEATNQGHAIDVFGPNVPTFNNCIVWGSTASGIISPSSLTISNSVVKGGYAGTGNTDNNPKFKSVSNAIGTDGIWRTADDGLQLGFCSAAYNVLSSTGALPNDITGSPIFGGLKDLGAYESQTSLVPTTSISIAASPSNQVSYIGNVTFTATLANAATGLVPTYKWTLNGAAVGTNSATYSNNALASGDKILCSILFDINCEAVSNVITMSGTCTSVLYVKPAASGTGNGSSWANATNDLQAAMTVAGGCNGAVWVAAGTYKPMLDAFGNVPSNGRDKTFLLKSSAKIYGGFVGTETALSQRNAAQNVTTLSGDFNGDDAFTGTGQSLTITGNSENAYHVVLSISDNATTLLDGFRIVGANANLASSTIMVKNQNINQSYGGALSLIASAATVKNCTFYRNYAVRGAGIFSSSSTSTINSCTFLNNVGQTGAVLYDDVGNINIEQCIFHENNATGGPIVKTYNANSVIVNCAFSNNYGAAAAGSAAITNDSGSPSIINCTFSNNRVAADDYSTVFSFNSNTTIKNTIIWYDAPSSVNPCFRNSGTVPTVTYSIIKGGFTGIGNKTADPSFINAATPIGADGIWRTADDGLQIGSCTSALNAGTNSNAPIIDIAGTTRSNLVDIGAYENLNTPVSVPTTSSISFSPNYVTIGTNVTFTATTNTPVGTSIQYQWTVNNIAAGTNSATFSSNTLVNNDVVKCTVTIGNTPTICYIPNVLLTNTITMAVNCLNARIYVKPTASGTGDGSSWANATSNLQAAINATSNDCNIEVWVGAGIHKPTVDAFGNVPSDARSRTFLLKNNAKIYGGFAGTETALSQRNVTQNVTTLSGDFNDNDALLGTGAYLGITGNGENAYKVVVSISDNAATLLDGFTITGANANFASSTIIVKGKGVNQGYGGALSLISSAATVKNCTFYRNYGVLGAAIFPTASTSTINSCNFVNNVGHDSPALYDDAGSVKIEQCIFHENNGTGGPTLKTYYANTVITNCAFSNNNGTFSSGAGAVVSISGSPSITNCTFSNNKVSVNDFSTIYSSSSNLKIKNTIVWFDASYSGSPAILVTGGPPNVTYSVVKDGFTGVGNTGVAPSLLNTATPIGADGIWRSADDGLQISCGSSGFNTGTSAGATTTDILGANRTQFGGIDIGAYESPSFLATSIPTLQVAVTPSTTISSGIKVTFTVNGTYLSSNAIFQWKINGNNVGTNSAVFSSNTLLNGDVVSYSVINNNVCQVPTPLSGSFTMVVSCGTSPRLYVKPTETGTGDGTSWANATSDLQTAINNPCGITEIWVANGVYKPLRDAFGNELSNPRSKTFLLKNGIKIYGGFVGNENNIAQRPLLGLLQGTLLVGDLNADDALGGSGSSLFLTNNSDNVYHVLMSINDDNTTLVDGFNIFGGNANGTGSSNIKGLNVGEGAGGGIFNSSATEYKNCNIFWNNATTGGGIYNASASNPNITGCTITSNKAVYGGGTFNGTASTATYSNCLMYGNHATVSGGAAHQQFSNTKIINNTISNNYVPNSGAAIYNEGGTNTLTNAIVWGNSGGLAYVSTSASTSLTATYSTIQGGYAGVGNVATDPNFLYSGIPQGPDAIYQTADDGLQLNCGTGAANTGTSTDAPTTDFLGNPIFGASKDMGAYEAQTPLTSLITPTISIVSNPATPTVLENTLVTFTATVANGLVNPTYKWYVDGLSPVVTSSSTFSDTLPLGYHSVYCEIIASQTCLVSSTATSNTINFQVIYDCPTSNILYVKSNATGLDNGSSWADARTNLQKAIENPCGITEIWVASGTYLPSKSAFGLVPANPREKLFLLPNGMKLYGGFVGTETTLAQRIFLASGSSSILSGDLAQDDVITGGNITNNDENAYHIVLTMSANNPNTTIDGFTISGGNANGNQFFTYTGNAVYQSDGAIHNTLSLVKIKNCVLKDNRATNGGAIFNTSSAPIISDCSFTNNVATKGGAIYNHIGTPTITNCQFTNNVGTKGGVIYSTNNSNFSAENCIFTANLATDQGGVFHNIMSSPLLQKCIFENNTSSSNGGAIYNYNYSSPTISKCIFHNNTAAAEGGAIYSYNYVTPTITNSVFSNNNALNGGAIYNSFSALSNLMNCTFYNNSATQQAKDLHDSGYGYSSTFTNCIVWGSNNSIYINSSPQDITYSVVQGGFVGNGNTANNPLFMNGSNPKGADNQWFTADDGLQLGACSPAYNTGTSVGAPTVDILDVSRPQFSAIDMGAYESQTVSIFTPSLTIAVNPPSITFGDNATFTATLGATIPTGVMTTYQWLVNGVNVGTNSPTYSTTTLFDKDTVSCIITVAPTAIACPTTTTAISNKIIMQVACPTSILYVKPVATGTGSGYSWANASADLQGAINNDCGITEIWIAAGTYLPSKDVTGAVPFDARAKVFYLKNGTKLYGGFKGTETSIDQRDIPANPTILSGDFNGNDVITGSGNALTISNNSENAYHVVLSVKDTLPTVLDGLTIIGGNANGQIIYVEGETIQNAYGGGLYVMKAQAFQVKNCNFYGDVSYSRGGAVSAELSNIEVQKSSFYSNRTTGGEGGAICTYQSNLAVQKSFLYNNLTQYGGGAVYTRGEYTNNTTTTTFTNSVFYQNTALIGGAIYLFQIQNATLTNCTLYENYANTDGNLTSAFSNLNLKNNILWASTLNSTFSYSSNINTIFTNNLMLQGYGNTITSNPNFVNASNPKGVDGILGTNDDGLTLACNSPARDGGSNAPSIDSLDIVGNPIFNVTKDIGAYERQNNDSCQIYTGPYYCSLVTIQNVNVNRWHNFYINNQLVASINPNGQNLGNVTLSISDALGTINSNGTQYLGRSIELVSTIAPTQNYSLRLYYKDSELAELNTAQNTTYDINFLSMAWKSIGGSTMPYTCDWFGYSGLSFGTVSNLAINAQEYGLNNDGFYLGFDLDHFTIFAPTTAGSALPLNLLDFSGKNISERENVLTWKTANEVNVSHFEVENLANSTWKAVGKVTARNGKNTEKYDFTHDLSSSAFGNDGLYRLKIVDKDGRFEYSKIINIKIPLKANTIVLYPNPTNDILNIISDNYEQSYQLLNSVGQVVLQGDVLDKALDMSKLVGGMYYLKVGEKMMKVVRN